MSRAVTADPTTETWTWGQQALFATFGQGTPREGMVFSLILFVIVFSWTLIGLVMTVFLDVIFVFLFLFNFARAIYAWYRTR